MRDWIGLLVICTAIAIGLAGCGSSGDPGAVSGRSSQGLNLLGQAVLDGPLPQGVVMVDPSGTTTSIGAGGAFALSASGLPKNFSIHVTGGSSSRALDPGEELRLEVRDFDGSPQTLRVNLITTLVSHYMERHPELTVQQATAAVKRFLQLPGDFDVQLDHSRGRNTPFHDATFLQEAASHGGVATFFPQLVDEMDAGGFHSFAAMLEEEASLADKIGDGLTEAIGDALNEELTGWIISAIGSAIGLPGTDEKLEQISAELQSIQTNIDNLRSQLEQAIVSSTYSDLAGQLNPEISRIVEFTSQLAEHSDPDSLAVLQGQILQNQADMQTLADQQLGTGVLGKGLMELAAQEVGPLLSDSRQVATLMDQFDYYKNLQTLALNLLVDAQHAGPYLGMATPEMEVFCPPNYPGAVASYTTYQNNLRSQASQLPRPFADHDSFYDPRTGLVWSLHTFGGGQPIELLTYVFHGGQGGDWNPARVMGVPIDGTSFSPVQVGFSIWRFPTLAELDTLVAGVAGEPSLRNALASLGFVPGPEGALLLTADSQLDGSAIDAPLISYNQDTGAVERFGLFPPNFYILAVHDLVVGDPPLEAPQSISITSADAGSAGVQQFKAQGSFERVDHYKLPVDASALPIIYNSILYQPTTTLEMIDLSPHVVWTVSNTAAAEVSNELDTAGTLHWKNVNLGPVTLTATLKTLAGTPGTPELELVTSQGSLSVEPPSSVPARELMRITICPREGEITDPPPSAMSPVQVQFTAIAIYNDHSTENVTATATWTTSQFDFVMGATGLLRLTGTSPTPITVTATYLNKTDSTKIKAP
jgi:hypothetical protein